MPVTTPLSTQTCPPSSMRLRKSSVVYEMFSYPGVKRAFDDDSGRANYSADAANLAWSRTVDFLHRTLS